MHGLWRRLVEIVGAGRLDRETREELDHHQAMLARDIMRSQGVGEAEARRRARLQLGSAEIAREQVASERTRFLLDDVGRDAAYAARVLRRSPGLTALSIATMGLGIGASALLFTLVNAIVLRPLPYPDAGRLVRIFDTNREAGIDRAGAASGNIDDWRTRTTGFDGIAGYYAMGRTIAGEGGAEVAITAQVSDDFFPLIGVPPLLGRTFSESELRRAQFNSAAAPIGPDPVVIVSHAIWRQQFGSDPGVIGRTLILDRRPFQIVGVMPERFALPDPDVQLWIPWDVSRDRPRDQHYLGAIGRLRSGVSMADAEGQLNAVANALGEQFPSTNRGWGVRLRPLAGETVGDTARVLWVLLASVGLVLLVACANVALLSLMRGLDRSKETAVRRALGASSGRLLRQFLMESAVLSAAGGALGAALAVVGLRLLPRVIIDLPRLEEVSLDGRALTFIVAVTVLAAAVSGWPQAWKRARTAPLADMSDGSLRAGASASRHRLCDAIAIGQIALAFVLLAASGLLVRSFLHLRAADPGFDPRGVLVAPVFLDSQAYNSGDRTRTYYRSLFERLAALPGVAAVGSATTVPTSPLGPDFERPVWPQEAGEDPARRVPAAVRIVTPGYFGAMGLRIASGRGFDDRDAPQARPVVMVSTTLARRLWPGTDAVGQQLVVDYSTAGTYPYEVVGIVHDVRFRGPRSTPLAEIYLAHAQRSYLIQNVVIRAAGDPRALMPAVRNAMKAIDPQKPPHGLYALEDLIGATYARDRQAMIALLLFAGTAVFLAILGVYGVLSQRVRERAREIGIRMAMGADPSRLVGWVAARGARMMAWGLAIGAAVAWALNGLLSGLLFGVASTDLPTVLAAAAMLTLVGAAATIVPSRRATRIDPVAVLRRG
jgi:predicted permease